ncbi:MAG TPA: imelysin family protein [Hyphomicrobium sp.]
MRDFGGRGARGCALLAAWLALAFAPGPAAAFDDAALARQAYEGIILPGYARFDAMARTFADKAGALCEAPSATALDETRAAARAALLAWARIEPLRFGPITAKQRLDRLLFYPDQHGIVAKQTSKLLAKRDETDIEPEKLAGASVAVQGFGAVDAVLYGNGSQAIATTAPEASFRCRYVRALAVDIAQIASETHGDWAGDYKRTWLAPGGDNKVYLTAKETTQALYRAYVTAIEVIRLQRLAPLLGGEAKAAGPVTPLLPHGGLGLPFILAGIEGERDILGDHGFLADDLPSNDKERSAIAILGSVATDLGFALRSGEAAAAMAPNALSDAKARERLAPMLLSLKNAEDTGRAALGALTGQTLGFNSLDGD